MAQTGISLGSAINAGIVATQITNMNTQIGKLNAIVAGPPGSPLLVTVLLRTLGSDTDVMTSLNLNAADSAVIINHISTAMQTLLAQYNATLAAMAIV